MAVRLRDGTVIYASEAQIEYVAKQIMGEAMSEGLVAPSWSDSGEVPVGEVTFTVSWPQTADFLGEGWEVYETGTPVSRQGDSGGWDGATLALLGIKEPTAKPSDPNAKPSLPSLSRVSGEAYRGLGWCDE